MLYKLQNCCIWHPNKRLCSSGAYITCYIDFSCYIAWYLTKICYITCSIAHFTTDWNFPPYNRLDKRKKLFNLICNICYNGLDWVLYNMLYNILYRYTQEVSKNSWFQRLKCIQLILFSSMKPLMGTVVLNLQLCLYPFQFCTGWHF